MKYVYTILIFFTLLSCDDCPDGVTVVCAAPERQLQIELVNEAGENLLLNETFNPEEVRILFNDLEIDSFFQEEVPDGILAINLNTFNSRDGVFDAQFDIELNATTTDVLMLNLNRTINDPDCAAFCTTITTEVNRVIYNNQAITFEDIPDTPVRIQVIR